MTLRVNDSCMPVIRKPNFSDETWDVKMSDIPIVVGNHSANAEEALQTISLSDYLAHVSDFMTNSAYKEAGKQINLLAQKESKDSHVIMSSQACFLPIIAESETKLYVCLDLLLPVQKCFAIATSATWRCSIISHNRATPPCW